jgi:sirohydrochlorin ferrochelatase
MTDRLEEQPANAGKEGGVSSGADKRIALLLVDHGSRHPPANAVLAEVASLVKQMTGLERVYYAHMDLAEPTVAPAVVVHPYFLSPGRHSQRDIPRLVEEAAREFPGVEFCVTAPLGVHPKIVEVILERAGIPIDCARSAKSKI